MELGVELATFLCHSFSASSPPEINFKFTGHVLVAILSYTIEEVLQVIIILNSNYTYIHWKTET